MNDSLTFPFIVAKILQRLAKVYLYAVIYFSPRDSSENSENLEHLSVGV
jgi:hypothetical protein